MAKTKKNRNQGGAKATKTVNTAPNTEMANALGLEPKVEEPKVEEPKVEEPKVEEPKADEPKVEEPKADEPKVEEPKTPEPKTSMAHIANGTPGEFIGKGRVLTFEADGKTHTVTTAEKGYFDGNGKCVLKVLA